MATPAQAQTPAATPPARNKLFKLKPLVISTVIFVLIGGIASMIRSCGNVSPEQQKQVSADWVARHPAYYQANLPCTGDSYAQPLVPDHPELLHTGSKMYFKLKPGCFPMYEFPGGWLYKLSFKKASINDGVAVYCGSDPGPPGGVVPAFDFSLTNQLGRCKTRTNQNTAKFGWLVSTTNSVLDVRLQGQGILVVEVGLPENNW